MSLDTWTGGPPTTAEAADCDAWLWRVMQSDKNKAMIARLEESLRAFLEDADQTLLPFPPRNAFHRKVCYLVARRYGLAHRLEQYTDPTTAPAVRLVLIKTPHSAQPSDSLAQLADRPHPDTAPKESVSRPGPVPTAKAPQKDDAEEQNNRPAATSTILRRPRTADGKSSRALHSTAASCAQPAASTLRSITEEDYRKARARIFKTLGPQSNEQDAHAKETPTNEQTRVMKIGHIAKGPVQGSTGFDRRRNRRNTASQTGHPSNADRTQKRPHSDKLANNKVNVTVEQNKDNGKGQQQQQQHGRASREQRAHHVQVQTQKSLASFSIGGGSTNGSFTQTAANGARRSAPYAGGNNSQNDLQDPDFDRRYDKWAVRPEPPHPPHAQQQIPVPIFSQLLYPYTVQASTPHLPPSSLHMAPATAARGPLQHGSVEPYQSIPLHHGPSAAMMLQPLAQGIGGLTAEYVERSMAMSNHLTPYDVPRVDHLASGHSREISVLQRQAIPPPVARAPSPAYGLDSIVDFPPLP